MVAYRLFCRINATLADYGQPIALYPLKPEKVLPNPVGALVIPNRGGTIRLRLRVPTAPAELTFVFGVRWCSRGQSVPRTNGVLLGRLPRAVYGWSEITDLYVKKFGHPPTGTRVFIWTRQVVNGRQDELKGTWADVPPPERQGSGV